MLILTWPRSLGKSQTFTGEGDTDVLIGSVVDNETFEAGDVVPFKGVGTCVKLKSSMTSVPLPPDPCHASIRT